MSTSLVRGLAGAVIGALGLLLLHAGPGIAVSALAAPGCKDDDTCRAVRSMEGWSGPTGGDVTSSSAQCVGPCDGVQRCVELTTWNTDGTFTIQCSCDPNTSPAACSGFAKIHPMDNWCMRFDCLGSCDPPQPPGTTCQHEGFEGSSTPDCPSLWKTKVKCVCK